MAKVLIVGAGPIGLLLGVSLRQYNVDVAIIDKIESRNSSFSKALTITSASLKIFHGLGLAQNFLNQGRKIQKAEIFFNKRKIATINKKYLDSLYNFYLSIPQFSTENILENSLNNYSTKVEYRKELISILQDQNSVKAVIKDLQTQNTKNEYFDFIVGCDGAHSVVRKLLEIPFVGHNYNMHFILGDVSFYENSSPKYATYYIAKEGFIGLFPMENGYTRTVIQKHGQLFNPKAKVTKEDIQPFLDSYSPNKLSICDLSWSSSARIVNRVVKSYRSGRVFLAGDAAHLFSPVGGQAMNTGIQDAFNLAWKLAHYLNGYAKEDFLDTYNQDRMLAVKKVTDSTDFYTKLITENIFSEDKKKYFRRLFVNREKYKKNLPNEFSGYKADYSQSSENFVGKHVPYVKFEQCYYDLSSTYDLPLLKKHVLFIRNSLDESIEVRELALTDKYVLRISVGVSESELIEKLKIDEKNICMICPSGYIVAHGNMSVAMGYLKQYYIE